MRSAPFTVTAPLWIIVAAAFLLPGVVAAQADNGQLVGKWEFLRYRTNTEEKTDHAIRESLGIDPGFFLWLAEDGSFVYRLPTVDGDPAYRMSGGSWKRSERGSELLLTPRKPLRFVYTERQIRELKEAGRYRKEREQARREQTGPVLIEGLGSNRLSLKRLPGFNRRAVFFFERVENPRKPSQ